MIKVKNTDGTWSTVTGAGGNASLVETTYTQLKALRDESKLVKGQLYRITDYVAYTSQTSTQSANKQFDIIVLADSANSFNENAWAINHVEDGFTDPFASCNLKAWEIKYCFDQDSTRFSWGGSSTYDHSEIETGKALTKTDKSLLILNSGGSVKLGAYLYTDTDNTMYYNTAPTAVPSLSSLYSSYNISLEETSYVVANLSADKKSFTSVIDDVTYTFELKENTTEYNYDFSQEDEHYLYYADEYFTYNFYVKESTLANGAPLINVQSGSLALEKTVNHIYTAPEAFRGIIYHMKDEWNNEAYYDFKGITYNSEYLFGGSSDGSLAGTAYDNVVAPYYSGKVLTLADISFSSSSHNNVIKDCNGFKVDGAQCYNNEFYNSNSIAIVGNTHNTTIRNSNNVGIPVSTANVSYCVFEDCEYIWVYSTTFTYNTLNNVVGTASDYVTFYNASNVQYSSFQNMGYMSAYGALTNSSLENSSYVEVTSSSTTITNSKICDCKGTSSDPITVSGTMTSSNILNSTGVTIAGKPTNTTIENCYDLNIKEGCTLNYCKFVNSTSMGIGTEDATAVTYEKFSIINSDTIDVKATSVKQSTITGAGKIYFRAGLYVNVCDITNCYNCYFGCEDGAEASYVNNTLHNCDTVYIQTSYSVSHNFFANNYKINISGTAVVDYSTFTNNYNGYVDVTGQVRKSRIHSSPTSKIYGVLSESVLDGAYSTKIYAGCTLSVCSIVDQNTCTLGKEDGTTCTYTRLTLQGGKSITITSTLLEAIEIFGCWIVVLSAKMKHGHIKGAYNLYVVPTTASTTYEWYDIANGNYGGNSATLTLTSAASKEVFKNSSGTIVERVRS